MAANDGNAFSCDVSVEEVTVNTITGSRPTISTSSASMISTSNVMDLWWTTQILEQNKPMSSVLVLHLWTWSYLEKVIQLALFGPVASLRGKGGQEGSAAPIPLKNCFWDSPRSVEIYFWGVGYPLDLDLPAAGLLFCFVKHNFFPTASVRHLIVNAMVLTA